MGVKEGPECTVAAEEFSTKALGLDSSNLDLHLCAPTGQRPVMYDLSTSSCDQWNWDYIFSLKEPF